MIREQEFIDIIKSIYNVNIQYTNEGYENVNASYVKSLNLIVINSKHWKYENDLWKIKTLAHEIAHKDYMKHGENHNNRTLQLVGEIEKIWKKHKDKKL